MKLIIRAILLSAIFSAMAVFPTAAIDISKTVLVERYTVLDSNTLRYETGYLLSNGQFKSVTSGTSPLYGLSVEFLEQFSGRPVMNADLFDAYTFHNFIPKWRRSREEYVIGFTAYCIVSTKSGPDPNPIPVILTQPASHRVLQGNLGLFFVETTIPSSVTYQWKFRNKAIPGETQPHIFIWNAQKADAGNYTVEVSTGGKPVVSKPALLQVALPVVIKTPPKSQAIKAGKKAVLRVTATGTGPFTYQWLHNGNTISGATKSSYTVLVTTATAGSYTVRVSSGPSVATSAAAIISVAP